MYCFYDDPLHSVTADSNLKLAGHLRALLGQQQQTEWRPESHATLHL